MNKIAVVTGGSSGIGKAIVEAFLEKKYKVISLDAREPNVESDFMHFTVDVTDHKAVSNVIFILNEKYKISHIDVLVNNAGVSFFGDIEQGSMEDWRDLFEVNLFSLVNLTRAFLPLLKRKKNSSIINLGSCLARMGMKNRAAYSATKGAVEALTRSMAADLISENIRVNCVSPGTVNTDFVKGLIKESGQEKEVFNNRQATQQLVEAEEVAKTVLFLSDPTMASFCGSVIMVEGGFSVIKE